MSGIGNRFSRIGYSGIFDSDMKVAWSNERRLFRKIESSKVFMNAYQVSSGLHEPFEIMLTFKGIRFKAVFLPLPDRRYLCIAYPEDRYLRFAYSEMYMRIFNIKCSADRAVAVADEIREAAALSGLTEQAVKLIDEQIRLAEGISYDAGGIAKIFDADNMCEYVNINDRINETYRSIIKYCNALHKTVTFDTDIKCTVAKINYGILESALMEIMRIMFRYMRDGEQAVLHIRGDGNTGLRISASLGPNDGFDPGCISYEIRDIKCAFEYMGGSASVAYGEDGLIIKAEASASLSNYNCRVKNYDLTDVGEDDPYEIISGYTGLSVGELKGTDTSFVFRCPEERAEERSTEFIADIMFMPLLAEIYS